MKKLRKSGFTLVELVIVIAVIAVLTGVLVPTFANIIENAKESSRYQQAVNAQKELVSAEGYLPEDTKGMYIEVGEKYLYMINDSNQLVKATVRIRSRLKQVKVDTVSNQNIKIYDKLEPMGILNGTTLINFGIAYYNNGTNVVYVDFENGGNPDDYFTITDGVLTLKSSYTNKVTEVALPENVTEIGANAFMNCTSLKNVVINSDVTKIGNNAFRNCSVLEEIFLPDSVESIGTYAFCYCKKLTRFVIPDKVQVLQNSLFSSCDELVDLTIGDGVKTIESNVFYNVKKIENLVIGDSLTSFTNIPGTAYINTIKHAVIGKGMTTIPNNAFQSAYKLETVEFRGNVTTIGTRAFYSCYKLESIDLPESVVTISDFAFRDCDTLTSVVLPTGVKQIYPYAFAYCNNLASVTSRGYITDIGAEAFYGCSNLVTLNINDPDKLETVGESAFRGCSKLTSNILGNNLRIIGENAFFGCEKIEGTLTLTDKFERMDKWAFRDCKKLETLVIEDGVEDSVIGSSGLSSSYFKYITIGNDFVNIAKVYMGYAVSVEIGTGMTEIPNNAFANASSLVDVEFHGVITSIGDSAFANCTKLVDFEIPSTVTSIGERAFYRIGMTRIVVPSGVTSIGNSAFASCSATEIILPAGVTVITDNMFDGASSLSRLECAGNITSIGEKAFYNCRAITTLDMNTDYITYIGPYAFAQTNYTSFICPSSKYGTVICQHAFDQSYNMGGMVVFADSMTEIGDAVCNEAHYVTHIVIGPNITSVGRHAFDNCGRSYGDTPVKVYYKGTIEQWREIEFESTNYTSSVGLCKKPRYYYSETAPTEEQWTALSSDNGTDCKGTGTKGYWHYDSNGDIVIWVK